MATSFLREGIENVRALVLPDGIVADGRHVAISHTALVTWRSALEGRLYQVYVNGTFAGATLDAGQRQLIVRTPVSLESAVRVEVVAVCPQDAARDFGSELAGPAGGGRVKLTLLRSQSLPIAGALNIYCDKGTGVIDYAKPLNASPVPVWPCRQDKAGFGMAQFGKGDFGYESAAAVGFGKGSFGRGGFGLDADVIEWTSPVLPLGTYRFGVTVLDTAGAESLADETEPVAVIPAATPAVGLGILEFNEYTSQLTLNVSD